MQLFNANVKSPVKNWDADIVNNPGVRTEVREKVLSWAHGSTELNTLFSADLLLYDFSLSIFKEQTKKALGTVWD